MADDMEKQVKKILKLAKNAGWRTIFFSKRHLIAIWRR